MEKPGTDDTVPDILFPGTSIYIWLTSQCWHVFLTFFQLQAGELMKIKVKGGLLFSSCYVKLNSLLINGGQENTYSYQLSCSLSSSLCLQENQALSFNSTEAEIFWNRGGRAGSLRTSTQGGQGRPCELHRSPVPHTAVSGCPAGGTGAPTPSKTSSAPSCTSCGVTRGSTVQGWSPVPILLQEYKDLFSSLRCCCC